MPDSLQSARKLAIIMLLLAGTGCAAMDTPPQPGHGLDLRGTREPAAPLLAADMTPEAPSIREYRITAGPAASSVIFQSIERTDEHGAQWAINDDGARIEYWGTDRAGNLVLTVVIDYRDNAMSVFDPPLVLIYEEMVPGEQRREDVEMRVLDSRNPERARHSGVAQRTIEYIDDQIISTPLGEYRAQRLAVHFSAETSLATIERTSTLYLVPGVGVVAEQARERLRVMNLIDRDQEQTLLLSEMRELEDDDSP